MPGLDVNTSMCFCYFSVDSGDIQNLANVNLAQYPIHRDLIYPSRIAIQGQPQGRAYPMNTGPSAADHTGYHMSYGMMSQSRQTSYWANHNQSAMPGPSRIASHVTPNPVMDLRNDPQIISSIKSP